MILRGTGFTPSTLHSTFTAAFGRIIPPDLIINSMNNSSFRRIFVKLIRNMNDRRAPLLHRNINLFHPLQASMPQFNSNLRIQAMKLYLIRRIQRFIIRRIRVTNNRQLCVIRMHIGLIRIMRRSFRATFNHARRNNLHINIMNDQTRSRGLFKRMDTRRISTDRFVVNFRPRMLSSFNRFLQLTMANQGWIMNRITFRILPFMFRVSVMKDCMVNLRPLIGFIAYKNFNIRSTSFLCIILVANYRWRRRSNR